jgi:cytochrome d ubiquinol oxidase subunit II
MSFQIFWFIAIAVLWTGFLVLEGFDFGVGILRGVVGKTDEERRVAINTIGPLWDGNEVWLIVAAASMFAAFPAWYATMFSGFYVALVLLLVALIARGVSFEFRGKRDSERWRRNWDRLSTAGSLLAPFLIGVALANLLHGVPIDADQEFTGSFLDLLNPYSLFAGLTLVLLCILHGSTFLGLRTDGVVRERATTLAGRASIAAGVALLVFVTWTQLMLDRGAIPDLIPGGAVIATFAVSWLVREHRDGWAFAMTAFAIATTVATFFIDLYPRVMVSSTKAANSLTIQNASSSAYSLKLMTIVMLVFLPLVLLYQGWTYYVFRRRVTTADLGD